MAKTVVLVGTLDTKGVEYGVPPRPAARGGRRHGAGRRRASWGRRWPSPTSRASRSPPRPAHDVEALRDAGDRGAAVIAMAEGATEVVDAAARGGPLRRRAGAGRLGRHLDRGAGHAGAAGRRAEAHRVDDRRLRHAADHRRERHDARGVRRRHRRRQRASARASWPTPPPRWRAWSGAAPRRARRGAAAGRREPVRRHDAVHHDRARGARGARLRGADVPHDRHRRALDGVADGGRLRARRARRDDDRAVRRARRRRLLAPGRERLDDGGPARHPAGRLARRARHGQLRAARDRARRRSTTATCTCTTRRSRSCARRRRSARSSGARSARSCRARRARRRCSSRCAASR